jgi:hypothetical protein
VIFRGTGVNEMTRDEIFPYKYLKAADLGGRSRILEIENAPLETLKNANGEVQRKTVLHFANETKSLPLNMINWDAVADICGADTDDWAGKKVEVYPTTTLMAGKTVPCIRIRAPRASKAASPRAKAAFSPPSEDPGVGMDEMPFGE